MALIDGDVAFAFERSRRWLDVRALRFIFTTYRPIPRKLPFCGPRGHMPL